MFSSAWSRRQLVSRVVLLALAGVIGAGALLALTRATGAVASAPMPASGTFTYETAAFNGIRMPGDNVIINDLTATVSYTGTFSGTSTVQGKLILHGDGTANFHDVEIFTGTVNGVPGTVTFNLDGTTDRAGIVRATDVIVSATGDLASLHGVLNFVGTVPNPNGPVGAYTGQIQSGKP